MNLLPVQQHALHQLREELSAHAVVAVEGGRGMGKTTVLRALHAELGGLWLDSNDVLGRSAEYHPLALENSVFSLIGEALDAHEVVVFDDFHLVATTLSHSHPWPRQHFLAAALSPLLAKAEDLNRRLVLTSGGPPITGLHQRIPFVPIGRYSPDDYALLLTHFLGGDAAAELDAARIHRFGPRLNARQLRRSCIAIQQSDSIDTESFIEHLRKHNLAGNVDLGEVQEVELHDLKGIDDVLTELEAHVILPLENTQLTDELQLRAKRGVLLAGPPGTGKTTIGRALARRLRGKFFLLDGTVIAGTPHFYARLEQIFEAAKQNAPCVIFIDDSDVIFETGRETGMYRYLLTMLDGLESTSAGRICVMMTAMDVGNMPPALVRSGRIELWLETRLPDADARREILAELAGNLPESIGAVDIDALVGASELLSGADLKRIVDDGKLLLAHDRARGRETRPATEYFLLAILTVRRNREQYAAAEARARARHPQRPPWFDSFDGSAGGGFFSSMRIDEIVDES